MTTKSKDCSSLNENQKQNGSFLTQWNPKQNELCQFDGNLTTVIMSSTKRDFLFFLEGSKLDKPFFTWTIPKRHALNATCLRKPHTPAPPPHLTPSPCSSLNWLSDLFSYKPLQNVPQLPSGPFSTHLTNPGHLHTKGQAISTLFPPLEISLPSSPFLFSLPSVSPYIHWRAKGTWYTAVSHHYWS